MQGEVQSYDLLQNDKYGRLDELKHVLESVRPKAASTQNNKVKNWTYIIQLNTFLQIK